MRSKPDTRLPDRPTRRQFLQACSAAALVHATPALSQAGRNPADWPWKPVQLVVPNAPGGATDLLARLLESGLTKVWSQQPIVVEYKAGAGMIVGTDYVARSEPDGHALAMVATAHVINPVLRRQMPYDTVRDLSAITLTTKTKLLLSVSPSLPVESLEELIAYAKARPGELSYATAGAGSSMHLAGELFKQLTGINIVHVPYKGSGGAYPDIASGRVEIMIDPLTGSMPQVVGKRLKPIAILSKERATTLPNVPAASETLDGLEVESINGIVVPSATPKPLIQKINADIVGVIKDPAFAKRLEDAGHVPVASTPEYFDELIQSEITRWQKVVKAGNIAID